MTAESSASGWAAAFLDLGWTLGEWFDGGDRSEFRFYGDVVDSLRMLAHAGLRVVVVTNQKRVAAGRRSMADVDAVEHSLRAELGRVGVDLAGWYVCPHGDEDGCGCRKPATGLLELAARELSVDLSRSWVVGDLWRDVLAGKRVGASTAQVVVSGRVPAAPPPQFASVDPDVRASSLLAAVKRMVSV